MSKILELRHILKNRFTNNDINIIGIGVELHDLSFYNEIGKNRIQYESFRWKGIYTNNFEIYFNNNSDKIAEIASDHLEKNFLSLTSYVGHQPFKKTKVFIFNSEKDLNQINI